jgi:glycine oxidase
VGVRDVDVVVIGAGVVGCTVAFELAAAGRRVRVCDPRPPGGGASFASAGVLAPYVEGHDSRPLRDLGRRSLAFYPAFVDRVTAAAGLPVAFRAIGTAEVATSAADIVRLARSKATADAEGVTAHWLDGTDARDAEPALAAHAAGVLHIPMHAAVDVPALTAASAAAARVLGAEFVQTAVRSLAAAAGGIAVTTADGVAHAPQVVLATGAWSAALVPAGAEPAPVRPIRGQLLHLVSAPDTLRHIVWGPDIYLVPWTSGTVFVGATSEDVGFDERTTASGVASLLARATTLVPALAGATFAAARQGLRPGSPDDLPYVGPSALMPGLFYACGHYRNGALLAPLTATLVASLVAGDRSDPALALVAPSRAGRL